MHCPKLSETLAPASDMSETAYLITGANRGIGLGIVQSLLQDERNIVFADTRDPSKATELDMLKTKSGRRLTVVQIRSGDVEDAKAAARQVEARCGKIDIVICNAGRFEL
jgi:NAD(P)-dependent dehydrogenase (short-subunit alcohol dehydrogenase family)